MVLEIAPRNILQLMKTLMEISNRFLSVVIGFAAVVFGTSVLVAPGFETEAMTVIKGLLGVLLIVFGVTMVRVGGARKPVELAFDRQTQEWKLTSRKGQAVRFEQIAPRGSVLRVNGLDAAMRSDREEPLFDFHLETPARMILLNEAERLAASR